jgi:hypothetical protein
MRQVFTNDADQPIRRTRFSTIWRPAAKAAGLGAEVTFHDLRHYYASLLIQHGESVKVVQRRLGHKSAVEHWTPTRTCGRTPKTGPARPWTRCSAGQPSPARRQHREAMCASKVALAHPRPDD